MYFNLPNCPLIPFNKNCHNKSHRQARLSQEGHPVALILEDLTEKKGDCHCEQCMNTVT